MKPQPQNNNNVKFHANTTAGLINNDGSFVRILPQGFTSISKPNGTSIVTPELNSVSQPKVGQKRQFQSITTVDTF